MNTKMLTKVRSLYNSRHVSRATNRHNQRAWIKSVRQLGDKWLHAELITRRNPLPKHQAKWFGAVGWPDKLQS